MRGKRESAVSGTRVHSVSNDDHVDFARVRCIDCRLNGALGAVRSIRNRGQAVPRVVARRVDVIHAARHHGARIEGVLLQGRQFVRVRV